MSVKVAVVKTASAQYPTRSPYYPSVSYPEYPFPGCVQPEPNAAYDGVRQLFRLMRLDGEHIDTKQWNPLGHIIKPGMTVVIKPNFVRSRHFDGKDLFSMITHPSVLRVVADYCWIALKKSGRIVIADAPNFDADWTELRQRLGLQELLEFFLSRGRPQVELLDLRDYWGKSRLPFFETRHMPSCERKLRGDPAGALVINLGERSALCGFPHPEKYYGAVFDRRETITHHIGGRQEYEVSRTIMTADVIVSVPKLKVHKRCGTTLNIKGLVVICTNKNYLVHYTLGSPSTGGDQYPDNLFTSGEQRIINWERWMYDHFLAYRSIPLELVHRFIFGLLYLKVGGAMGIKIPAKKRVYEPGCWYANDSTWRMATDLMKVAVFADQRGVMQERSQRQFFSIVDGIIGGENKGPLTPDPVASRVLVGGENLLAVDIVATRMMGFDPLRVRMYRFLLEESEPDYGIHSFDDIEVVASPEEWQSCLRDQSSKFLDFKPHPGWVGHIEVQTGTEEPLKCKTVQYP
jgi:uncharacterized protein (DUF362 family)